MLGLTIGSVIFSALQKAHKPVGHSAYFQRQTTTIIGACVALTLVVGDIVMVKALGRQGSVLFGGLCAITAFAALIKDAGTEKAVYNILIYTNINLEHSQRFRSRRM
ncbi:hypothetical protein F4801DRAFT_570054 [Xylaria longipes]|nr:hypothetical protein F4801DRAFT_570054 [Xylaria longipes]